MSTRRRNRPKRTDAVGRRLLLLGLLVILVGTIIGSAAFLNVDGGVIQVFEMRVTVPVPEGPIPATVDIKPESLQKKSQGQPVTAYIELPQGYDVADILVDSLRLCQGSQCCEDGVAADGAPGAKPKLGEYGNDGVPDLKVSFDRAEVISLVQDVNPPASVVFTVSGKVGDRTFAGSDTMKLVDPEPTLTLTATPAGEATPTPTPTLTEELTVTAAPTLTEEPMATPSPGATEEPMATPTATPTPTPTEEPAATPTPSPTEEPTPTEKAARAHARWSPRDRSKVMAD